MLPAVRAVPVVQASTPRVSLMAVPAVTRVPVVPAARVATQVPELLSPRSRTIDSMVVPVVLVARRDLRVRVPRTLRWARMARRVRVMVALVASVVRAVMVAMVVPAVWVAPRAIPAPRVRRVRLGRRLVVLPAVGAVPVVSAGMRRV